MIRWADIPSAAKMTAGIIPVIAGVVLWLFGTFETASGAEQKWAQHNQAIQCRTVYELQQQIRAYLQRLQFDTSLNAAQQQWLREEIDNLQAQIQRLDPEGRC